jgi:enolase
MIKEIKAKSLFDSRKIPTISVIIKGKRKFITSAPSGKSTGKYEAKPYKKGLEKDIEKINRLKADRLNKIIAKYSGEKWGFILRDVERIFKGKIGANTLFALEASILKYLANSKSKELWEFLGGGKIKIRPVGNTIGGGLHSKGIKDKKPDFQEFLFIGNGRNFKESVKINKIAYKIARKLLKTKRVNDEGALETDLDNESVLRVMEKIRRLLKERGLKVDIGLDIAASSFYKNKKYFYKNPNMILNSKEQTDYLKELIIRYKIFYIEDGLDEEDFSGFKKLKSMIKNTDGLIVGDDLTTTNPIRLKKAIKNKSINAIIVKPNQIGSLLKVKEVVEIAKKNKISTIISHRSGETLDNTIADLGVGFGVDFIKTGVYGKVRTSKLNRLIKIERRLKNVRKRLW